MTVSSNGQGPGRSNDDGTAATSRHLRFDVAAEASCLPSVRRRVELWSVLWGAAEEVIEDLVFAVNETVTNTVEHAYPSSSGRVWIEARWVPECVSLDVVDAGRWRPTPPDPGFRGRGLLLLRRLADTVEVHHDDTGTRVHMRWRLPR